MEKRLFTVSEYPEEVPRYLERPEQVLYTLCEWRPQCTCLLAANDWLWLLFRRVGPSKRRLSLLPQRPNLAENEFRVFYGFLYKMARWVPTK